MKKFLRSQVKKIFSARTRTAIRFDLSRLRTRLTGKRSVSTPAIRFMHLGSGARRLEDWLNVDLAGADVNIDLTKGRFPFPDNSFECIVSQHLIEHLDLEDEVVSVFREVCRVLKPGGELWLSTPDMEKICREYTRDGGRVLYEYIRERDPHSLPAEQPASCVVNTMFFQRGLHKNLFDFPLLQWALSRSGLVEIERKDETDLLKRFPGFPPRHDEFEALSIRCIKPA